jgi:hypothetical protein
MGTVLTRADWNALLQAFNTAKATSCSFYDDLLTVGPKHLWNKEEILRLHNSLVFMTKRVPALETLFARWETEWDDFWDSYPHVYPDNLEKWYQTIIDELNFVLTNFECRCTEAMVQDVKDLDGTPAYAPYTFDSSITYLGEYPVGTYRYEYNAEWSFAPSIGEELGFDGIYDESYKITNRLDLDITTYGELCMVYEYDDSTDMGDVMFDNYGVCDVGPTDSYSTIIIVADSGCPTPSVTATIVQEWSTATAQCAI